MSKKHRSVLGLLLAIGLLMVMAVIPAFAQGNAFGRGQFKSLTGSDVYQFTYNGGKDNTAQVVVNSDPANAVKFTVYTSSQWQQRGAVLDKEDAKNRFVGQGTRMSTTKNGETTTDLSSDLIWGAGGRGGGTYFVLVEPNQGFQNQNIRYWIDFTGDISNAQFVSGQGNNLNQMASTGNQQTAQAGTGNQQTAQAGTGNQQTAQGPQTLPQTGAARQGSTPAPQTLPQTGGELVGLAIAGLTALAGGLALRKR